MRRLRGKFTVRACEFQAASMIDLGFLLFTFLIAATVFAIKQGVPLVLPGGERVTRFTAADVLEIRALGDGTVTAGSIAVPATGVRALVEARLARDPELVIVLATAPDANYGAMIMILDQLKQTGCRRISLRTGE